MGQEDVLGIDRALRLHYRVRHIHLNLPSSILHEVLVLMHEHFPVLEHLSLSSAAENGITITLPKAFLAPNLRHLALRGINPQKRLRLLTFTVSLVTLKLNNIGMSSYFRPSLLAARLQSLPHLEELSIGFSAPIPRPSAERELLGQQGALVTLPNLKKLCFEGVSTYLEFLVTQIRAPLLEQLVVALFNQTTFALPHLFNLINITEGFKLPRARISFDCNDILVTTTPLSSTWFYEGPFSLRVKCRQLNWQIDCAAQICNAIIPALSGVERFELGCDFYVQIPTPLEDGAIDRTTWHELLRPFIGMKVLVIEDPGLLEELSRALQFNEVGSDPGFLPNLQYITARLLVEGNFFTSFIDTRRARDRPVQLRKR
ncbi:hypothetical protein V8E53_007495 [Lactarius tabidus]